MVDYSSQTIFTMVYGLSSMVFFAQTAKILKYLAVSKWVSDILPLITGLHHSLHYADIFFRVLWFLFIILPATMLIFSRDTQKNNICFCGDNLFYLG